MKRPRVTDHCVLRYLERVRGLDVETIRRHIEDICAPAVATGATSARIEGFFYRFSGGSTVLTVLPAGAQSVNKADRIAHPDWPRRPAPISHDDE